MPVARPDCPMPVEPSRISSTFCPHTSDSVCVACMVRGTPAERTIRSPNGCVRGIVATGRGELTRLEQAEPNPPLLPLGHLVGGAHSTCSRCCEDNVAEGGECIADLLPLIVAQQEGALRPAELACLMARLEKLFREPDRMADALSETTITGSLIRRSYRLRPPAIRGRKEGWVHRASDAADELAATEDR